MTRGDERLREEFIVCYAPGYPDPFTPWPNTLENAIRFRDDHQRGGDGRTYNPKIKRRLVSDWEWVEA